MFNTAVFIKRMIAESYLLEKNENTAFSLRLTFPGDLPDAMFSSDW